MPMRWSLGAPAAGLAMFFVYLELLKSHRASQWSGFLPSDIIGIAGAFLAYTGVLWLLLWALGSVGTRLPWRIPGASLLLAGGLVWALLSVHREDTPTIDDALVLALLLTFSGAAWIGARSGRFSMATLGGGLLIGWLIAIASLYSAGNYFLFSPQRAREVTLYPVAWWAPMAVPLAVLLWRRHTAGAFILVGLLGVALPLVACKLALYAPPRDDLADRPNMVLFISDTLRADYCSAYGGAIPTPRLQALSEEGVRFDHHYALAPWTLPSMTGFFSSQYPKSLTPDAGHKTWTLEMNRYEVDVTEPTLPMRLEAAGYRMGAFTSNAFLPSVPGMMYGYHDHASAHPILLEDKGYVSQLPLLSALLRAWFPVLVDIRPHNTTEDLDRYARAFIQRHRDKPFFLWIHYIDPHAPYDPPAPLRRVAEGPWPFFYPYEGGEAWGLPILGKNFAVEEPDQDYVTALYEGEVAYIDGFVGKIEDALRNAGVAEETYFCFTSDHGEELWDHGMWGHGQSMHDELLRVPLILRGPGIKPAVLKEPVSALDVVPTLAALMGVPPADSWRGESLAPVLRGEALLSPGKPVFALGSSNKAPENPLQMVVHEGYKLIRVDGGGGVTLFDLAADPEEQRDIAAEHPEIVARLLPLLDAWLESFSPYFEPMSTEFDQDAEQRLEGMGYL